VRHRISPNCVIVFLIVGGEKVNIWRWARVMGEHDGESEML
jgi:hypothetical protein